MRRRLWVIRGGEDSGRVDDFVAAGVVGLHYPDVPDGRSVDRYDVTERLRARGWTSPEVRADLFHQFVNQIGRGDLLVMPDPPRRDVVIGRVDGDYEFLFHLDPDEHRHRRAVAWLARHRADLLPEGARDLARQRAVLAERSTPALVAHAEAVERGELGRSPGDTSAPGRPPRAVRPASAPKAPKAVPPAGRRCSECFLVKAPDLFPGGGEVCVDCGG